MLGAISAHIFREFVKVFRDFAQILRDFAWIFTKSKLLGLHLHLSYTSVCRYSAFERVPNNNCNV